MKTHTVIYKIIDPDDTIEIQVDAENLEQAQERADDIFQMEHSTDMWKDYGVDIIIEENEGEVEDVWHHFRVRDSISITWCVDDVRCSLEERFGVPKDSLTHEECMEVLMFAERKWDAEIGFSYETINCAIEALYEDKIAELKKGEH